METKPELTRPMISVDRSSKSIAVFDNFKCIRDFKPYENEQAGVDEARNWIRERTTLEPEMVYPRITKMRMS